MLILTLVCVAWLEIIGIQSAKKEARRREAVERLAGMMDAFMYEKGNSVSPQGYWIEKSENGEINIVQTSEAKKIFANGDSPIGYQLRVVNSSSSLVKGMSNWTAGNWLVGLLFNDNGGTVDSDGKLTTESWRKTNPFFKLAIKL